MKEKKSQKLHLNTKEKSHYLRDNVHLKNRQTQLEVLFGPSEYFEEVIREQVCDDWMLVVGARAEPSLKKRLPVQAGGTHVDLNGKESRN